MSSLRLVLGDQLSHSLTSLNSIDKNTDVVMICEVIEKAKYVKHHKKKIAFLFSAMRHFAEELRKENINVRYIKLDDPKNTGSFTNEIKRAVEDINPEKIILTQAGEYRVLKMMQAWQKDIAIPVDILPDTRFLASHADFTKWAKDKKQLRMEFFYREMRKKYNILIDSNGNPEGGEWNYDKENRKPPKNNMFFPNRLLLNHSAITQDVIKLVDKEFYDHFGSLSNFNFAVTRKDALNILHHFIDTILPYFGEYQDAMVAGEPYLYHSLISLYLNAGLLLPIEICKLTEEAYMSKKLPINATEGFIRQILGWREYIRGIYWYYMPKYKEHNYLNANNPLPDFYWTGKTNMLCMAEAIRHTSENAYSHHIQRLMITGNFALLAALSVSEICDWYLSVYADAYEWVELPNTLGMALFADGGVVASKPYAASGKYINKMSNYCKNCKYDPETVLEENSCPFNSLYWNFIEKNYDKIFNNNRMINIISTWNKMSEEKRNQIIKKAKKIMSLLDKGLL
ncbi:MAG: cryptochrome/photolyase family protein [Pseudomonadota bacterium]